MDNARPTECRLIVDPPTPGAWNMAVDEALLVDAAENATATLRFYRWSEPTLSLGYFQRYEDRHQHAASRDCQIVRRQTGGGAILHDRELTYSLTLPGAHPLARQTPCLYASVHDAFIAELQSTLPSIAARWNLHRRACGSDIASSGEPFLCFQRQAAGDVLLAGPSPPDAASEGGVANAVTWKILGSAQRRHRGAVLQHGSLLLERSTAAPELPGLLDLSTSSIDLAQLTDTLGVRLAEALEVRLVASRLPPPLESKATKLANNKYGVAYWTNRR